jgi:threonine dehydrogenase-like Zn-dependent dehydrogenase
LKRELHPTSAPDLAPASTVPAKFLKTADENPPGIAPERSIVGSEYFRYNELPANLQRLQEHRGYLSQIITHRMGVDQIQQAFEAFFFGCETGKVIIEQ